MSIQLILEQEPTGGASFFEELEIFDVGTLFHGMNKPAVRELLLGAGGSALAHLLVALGVFLLPFVQPPPAERGAFLAVSLVEMGGGNGGSGDLGSVAGSDQSLRVETSPPTGTLQAKAPPQAPQKTVKQVAASPDKTRKKPLSPPAVQPASDKVVPDAEPPAALSTASVGSVAEKAGQNGEQGQGARGAGAVSGSSSPVGTGLHAGEFGVDAVDQAPEALHKVEPVYPPRARKQGICGRVVLRFLVEPDGQVARLSILETDPAGYFEQSALDAIRHWRFRPGIYRGRAVSTWMVLPVQFRLTSKESA